MHSNYADEETSQFLIKGFLMKEYHLSLREIDDLPYDFTQFLVLIKKEEVKKTEKEKNKQERRMKGMTRRR